MGADHQHSHTHDLVPAPPRARGTGAALRVGIGGPVGTGKTELVAALCRVFVPHLSVVVVTNDIYTREDAEILERRAVIDPERLVGVETGCCPHTAIRDDISENLDVIETLEARFSPDLVLLESGGDNLTLTFSRALVDVQIFVIDVAGGDKVPRKGGPGITTSDLLVINKTDLAPHVGADLDVMRRDARLKRRERPFAMVSLRDDPEATVVAAWVRNQMIAWAGTDAGTETGTGTQAATGTGTGTETGTGTDAPAPAEPVAGLGAGGSVDTSARVG